MEAVVAYHRLSLVFKRAIPGWFFFAVLVVLLASHSSGAPRLKQLPLELTKEAGSARVVEEAVRLEAVAIVLMLASLRLAEVEANSREVVAVVGRLTEVAVAAVRWAVVEDCCFEWTAPSPERVAVAELTILKSSWDCLARPTD